VGTQKFQIDPAAFRSSADETRGVADKLHGIWSDLQGLGVLGFQQVSSISMGL
jgi:hypothetical protein